MILWHGSWSGKLARVNERTIPIIRGGRPAQILSPTYRNMKNALAMLFRSGRDATIRQRCDLLLHVTMWKRKDTDSPLKVIEDALELAGVYENDNLVRDILIRRFYHRRDDPDVIRVWLLSTEADHFGGVDIE